MCSKPEPNYLHTDQPRAPSTLQTQGVWGSFEGKQFPTCCPISAFISATCCLGGVESHMAIGEVVTFLSRSTKGETSSLTASQTTTSHFPNENMIQKKKKFGHQLKYANFPWMWKEESNVHL